MEGGRAGGHVTRRAAIALQFRNRPKSAECLLPPPLPSSPQQTPVGWMLIAMETPINQGLWAGTVHVWQRECFCLRLRQCVTQSSPTLSCHCVHGRARVWRFCLLMVQLLQRCPSRGGFGGGVAYLHDLDPDLDVYGA